MRIEGRGGADMWEEAKEARRDTGREQEELEGPERFRKDEGGPGRVRKG